MRPSLVLVETNGPEPSGAAPRDKGIGSGVVVSLAGDILTSLHVVADASDIQLTFADGTRSQRARSSSSQPENDIAVLRATQPPAELVPATLGDPDGGPRGQRGLRPGQAVRPVGSMSAGVISGLDRSFTCLEDTDTVAERPVPDRCRGQSGQQRRAVPRIATATSSASSPPSSTRPSDDVFIGIGLAVPIDVAGGAAGLPPY